MSHDISVCNGCIGKIGDQLRYCPIRDNCKRHSLFLQYQRVGNPDGIWMVVAGYKDGKCELQIKKR